MLIQFTKIILKSVIKKVLKIPYLIFQDIIQLSFEWEVKDAVTNATDGSVLV